MAGFPVPAEARLEALLREAFEFMPGPDMARLAEIESRLLRAAPGPARRRRAAPPWWVILLVAGGAASAAWWTVERLSGQKAPALRSDPFPAAPAPRTDSPRGTGDAPSRQTDDRIIYERETH